MPWLLPPWRQNSQAAVPVQTRGATQEKESVMRHQAERSPLQGHKSEMKTQERGLDMPFGICEEQFLWKRVNPSTKDARISSKQYYQ